MLFRENDLGVNMGKTDPFVFSAYKNVLNSFLGENKKFESVCFLGQPGTNALSRQINFIKADFYDSSVRNWNINDEKWDIPAGEYDLIVCTRCAYFAKDVESFFSNCKKLLKEGGILLVDWGLGDHWRYENYKIGWVKDGEHESFYQDDNFLWSTIWHESFKNHPNYLLFEDRVKPLGYENVRKAMTEETPEIYSILEQQANFDFVIDIQTYWEDSPQLYFIFCGSKK